MQPLIAGALKLLPQAIKYLPKILPYLPSIMELFDGGGSSGDGTGGGGGNSSGGNPKGNTPRGSNSGNSGNPSSGSPPKEKEEAPVSSSIATISDAVKSVSDSFTSTFISAGQAVSNTATNIASGATSIVGSVGGAVNSAVSNIAGAITSLTASLGPVGAIIGGIASAASAVTGAVVGIATGITNSVIAVGTAVLNTATTIATTVVSLIGSVVSTCSTFISTISGLFSGASSALGTVSVVATAVAGVLSGVANAIGSIIGALASVVSGIVSAVTSVVGALTTAFQSVSESLGALAGIAGEALGGLIGAVQSCIQSLMSFASNVTKITAQTGMSITAASNLTTSLGAVGISSGEVAKMFGSINMRPEVFNARSAATGLARMDDPNFASNEAKKFQDLVKKIGYPAAKSRLDAQFGGQAPEQILRMVNVDPAKLRANEEYGKQVQSQLGVGPDQLKAASEDLPLLMNRVSAFIDAVKIKFAAELLPALEGAFNVVSKVLGDNAGNIANLIKTATTTIFVDGPDLAASAALTVLDWAQAVSDAFFAVVSAGIEMARSFMNGDGPVFGILAIGASFIDSLIEIGAQFAGAAAAVGAIIKDAILTLIPGGKMLLDSLGVDSTFEDPTQAYEKAYSARHQNTGYRDMLENTRVANRKNVMDSLDAIEAGKNEKQATVNSGLKFSRGMINSAHAQTGTTEERRKMMEDGTALQKQSIGLQQQLLDVNKQQLDATKAGNSGGGSGGQIVARMGAYLAQDAYRLTSR